MILEKEFSHWIRWYLMLNVDMDKDLARRFEVARSTVRRWARGSTFPPSNDFREQIVKYVQEYSKWS